MDEIRDKVLSMSASVNKEYFNSPHVKFGKTFTYRKLSGFQEFFVVH